MNKESFAVMLPSVSQDRHGKGICMILIAGRCFKKILENREIRIFFKIQFLFLFVSF